ncbi:MAG: MazG nucleotide pyrophosphohydrolase domain-containing protein [candidate division WOR-3 bacterium]
MEIRDFQRKILETYGEKDAKRGLWPTFGWMVEEIGELAKALRKGNRNEIKEEFADAMAWLFTVANLAGIDMDEAVGKYEAGCPKCGKSPCECREAINEGP